MPDFRIDTPRQTCNKTFRNYRSYKKYLIIDFYNRCGYCDGGDTWHGGHKHFHIDHFAPKDQFPGIKTAYSNLIYSCPSCNLSKSNKWPGFLNPITDDLNTHFERDDNGSIIGISDIAKSMIISLNLNLERHSVIWKLTMLEELIKKIGTGLNHNLEEKLIIKLEGLHYEMLKIFFEYQQRLKSLNFY